MIKLVANCETGEVLEVEMTKEEIAQRKADEKEAQAFAEAKAKAEADKAALLARLGITEAEAKLLLG